MLAPRRLCRVVVLLAVLLFALPAAAHAASVTVRIESKTGTLVPRTGVQLPTTEVAPVGAQPGQACSGNSVVGAVDAATGGDWAGTWSDTTGWSLDRIKATTALPGAGRKWIFLIGDVLVNGSPCQTALNDGDTLTLIPACLTSSTTGCIKSGILELYAPAIVGPGAPVTVTVYGVTLTIDSQGVGTSQRAPSLGTAVFGPEGSAFTDSKYGTGSASLLIKAKGPAVISTARDGWASDSVNICITDGADGYCGTTTPDPIPFDPHQFCTTTGTDGYCGSPDQVAPVGRVGTPLQGQALKKGPTKLTGTVDFDPSLTDHVDIQLMRKITVTVTKYTKKKAWVTRKVKGKKVRKRVIKRIPHKSQKAACYGWSDVLSDFVRLKKCDPATAPRFAAAGAEIWSYELIRALVKGSYTLDALAQDGAGNVDSIPELGRNRVTFTVS